MKFKGIRAFLTTSRDVKLLLLAGFFVGFGFTGFGLILNLYLKLLGFGEGIIGTFLASRTWATMLMTLPAAFLMRRLRLKPILVASVILTSAGALLAILTPSTAPIAVGMIVMGLVGSFVGVVGGPMIMRGTAAENQPFLFSLNFAIGLVSGILGNMLAGSIPDLLMGVHTPLITAASMGTNAVANMISGLPDGSGVFIFGEAAPWFGTLKPAVGTLNGIITHFTALEYTPISPEVTLVYRKLLVAGYRTSLLVHAWIGALALFPFLAIKTRKVVDDHNEHFFHVRTPWRRILTLAFPHVLVGLGAGLTVPFFNLHFREVFGLSPTQLGLLFSVVQVLMVGGTLLAPHIASRWGKIKTVIVFQMVSVPFLFLLSLQMNVWVSIAAFLARGALMNMSQPLVTNFSLEQTHKDDHPLMSGIMTVAWLAPWGISANLGGRLIEKIGYFTPFNLTLAAYVLSSVAYFFLLLPLERKSNLGRP